MDNRWAARIEEKVNKIYEKVVVERDEEIQRISKLESGVAAIWWVLAIAFAGIAGIAGLIKFGV